MSFYNFINIIIIVISGYKFSFVRYYLHTLWISHSPTEMESGSYPLVDGIAKFLTSYTIVVIIWILGLLLALPPLLGWSYYLPETNGIRYV